VSGHGKRTRVVKWAGTVLTVTLILLQLRSKQAAPVKADRLQPTPTRPINSAPANEATVRSYLLRTSSLWAMGANARSIPPRRRNVPLVTWSPDAVAVVAAAWRAVQQRAAVPTTKCARMLFVYPSYWGITSQMRDYSDAALLSLAFRRPLQHINDSRQPKWCPENTWLGCFFEGFDTESCRKNGKGAQSLTPNTSTLALRDHTFNQLGGPHSLVVKYLSELTFVLEDPMFFPTALWEDLINANLVHFANSQTGAPIDPGVLKQRSPNLYHTLALSCLRSILVPAAFPPQMRIRTAAYERLMAMRSELATVQPCVAVHLRWTDKPSDGGIAMQMQQLNAAFIVSALDHINAIVERPYRCVVLLTDDDKRALYLLEDALKHRDVKLIVSSLVSDFFKNNDDYKLYSQVGHSFVSGVMLKTSPENAFAYFRQVVVDIICAAALSDLLIGLGSSGVSQLLAQYMGHSHRVDPNAIALWQEDLLGLSWPP
jgi:hypothetical protein